MWLCFGCLVTWAVFGSKFSLFPPLRRLVAGPGLYVVLSVRLTCSYSSPSTDRTSPRRMAPREAYVIRNSLILVCNLRCRDNPDQTYECQCITVIEAYPLDYWPPQDWRASNTSGCSSRSSTRVVLTKHFSFRSNLVVGSDASL